MGCGSSNHTAVNYSISSPAHRNILNTLKHEKFNDSSLGEKLKTRWNKNDNLNIVNQIQKNNNINSKHSISPTNENTINIEINTYSRIEQYQSINYASSKFKWGCYLEEIDSNSSEFYIVNIICCLPYKIERIEKVINLRVYLKYISQKYLNRVTYGKVGEHVVFYGSQQDPSQICVNETGFDFRVNEQDKPLGEGLHFSEDTIFSHLNAFRNKNICKIVMAKIILGNIHEINSPDPVLRIPPDNSNFITIEINQTQRIYTCYENFNALPCYIITYNTDEEIIPPIFELWCWPYSEDQLVPFPDDINFLLNRQFREGEKIRQQKFKFLK